MPVRRPDLQSAAIFEASLFRVRQMPGQAIRTDITAARLRRAPCRSVAISFSGGLSWAIVPERIEAGHSRAERRDTNGGNRHSETKVAHPPAAQPAQAANARCSRFRQEYNEVRRMKRWACALQRGSMRGQRENFRSRCRKRTSSGICWCAACAAKHVFGEKTRCFLGECCGATSGACCKEKTTAVSRSTSRSILPLFHRHTSLL